MTCYTTREIADRVSGQLAGDGDLRVTGPETLELAGEGHITFIGEAKYAPGWATSKAAATLVSKRIELPDPAPGERRAIIRVANADLAMAIVLDMFAPPRSVPEPGIHPLAMVHPSAILGTNITVGPHCHIGARVRIGDGTILHPNVTIMDDTSVGERCEFFPGVVIRERCSVGAGCIFHPNVVIGADGFGYRPSPDGRSLIKITHIGTVQIGNDVEIGAGSCVDRAKFSATVIGDGTKLDNLVQIGHNCRVGRCCVLSSQVGLAGSVTLGDGVMMGGKAGIRDHVRVGSRVKIAGYAAVMDDIPDGQTWAGYPAQDHRRAMREALTVRKLPELVEQVQDWIGKQQ